MQDPIRNELRRWWSALIDGETTRSLAVTWTEEQLTFESWRDEVTHKGLQRLHDIWCGDWEVADDEMRSVLFRRYWDWMEIVHQYEDDPTAWNRWYALRFASRLSGADLQRKALNSFLRVGFVGTDDVAEFHLA